MAYSRLGTMLHLEIQKWEEDMKASNFEWDVGGTAACTKIIMVAKKGCSQLTSRDAYFYHSWFSGLKTAEEEMSEGVYYCRPVKTGHKGFVYLH